MNACLTVYALGLKVRAYGGSRLRVYVGFRVDALGFGVRL